MKKYLIVAEKTETGYSAFSPDLPGCVATGRNRAELEIAMREAVLFHLDGLKEDHEAIPAPHSYCTVCEVPA